MSLANLIRGDNIPDKSATATHATLATQSAEMQRTVARVATVAVAKPLPKPQFASLIDTSNELAPHSCWWLIHFCDRNPQIVACYPETTFAGILEPYPEAVSAEPFIQAIRPPLLPMTRDEVMAIVAWLNRIEEADTATICEVFDSFRSDAEARQYFLGRVSELNHTGGNAISQES